MEGDGDEGRSGVTTKPEESALRFSIDCLEICVIKEPAYGCLKCR